MKLKRYKSLYEAQKIDISYINKRLNDFKKGINSENNLIDGILIDLGKRNDKKIKDQLSDHLHASNFIDNAFSFSKKDIIDLTKEIYSMFG